MPANRAIPSRPAKAMNSAGSSMRPSESIFISCALNSIVCRTSASFDRLSISSIASTIWPMRSGHTLQDKAGLAICKYIRCCGCGREQLKGAGTETRPLASSLFSYVDRNKSTAFAPFCRLSCAEPGLHFVVEQRRILLSDPSG